MSGLGRHAKQVIKSARVANTGAAANVELVAVVTDKRIHVTSVQFTSSAVCDFTLEDGNGNVIAKYLSVAALAIDPPALQNAKTDSGANLRYDTSTGNSDVRIEYYEGT